MNRLTIVIVLGVLAGAGSTAPAQGQGGTPAQAPAPCPHGIEGSKCPFCDPSRIERLGACSEHGVPEALCVECRPFLRQAFMAAGDWCDEHGTPDSQCALCNPEAAEATGALVESAGVDHRWRREPSLECTTSQTIVTLASPEISSVIGLEFAEVQAAPLERTIERNAELAYNSNRYARLSARAPGVVVSVEKDLGERVRRGDVLVTVDSADLGTAKTDILLALETVKLWEANAERERLLLERGVGIEREAMEAETRAAEARISLERARLRLRNLGLSDVQIEGFERERDTSSLLQITAPFDGSVVERGAVIGELADPAKPLVAVADTGSMWAMTDLLEADLARVRVGQAASVVLDGLPGQPFGGRVTWISTEIDRKTRTVKARIELDNGQGLLRANMFGRARIVESAGERAVTVPKQAVQWEGCCNIAFVSDDASGTTFRPVRLTLAFDSGDRYEVVGGLSPGDRVVTAGSFILKNELLKDAVGAGCCEVDFLDK